MKEVEVDDKWDQENTEPTEEELNGDGAANPFDPQVAPGVSLIVQMRIYDVLLAMYREQNEEAAAKLAELHATGRILGSLPVLDLDEE